MAYGGGKESRRLAVRRVLAGESMAEAAANTGRSRP